MTQSLLDPETVKKRRPGRLAPRGYDEACWSQVTKAVDTILVDAFKARRYPLYIHGPTGTGKTCVAALLFRSCSKPPLWARADDLLLSLSCGRTSDQRISVELSEDSAETGMRRTRRGLTFGSVMHRISDTHCLFLDDIAVRKPTESMRQIFFDLLEIRKGRPFVITSNHSPEELCELYEDDRILSRLLRGTVLHLSGGDRRDGLGKRFLSEVG